MFPYFMHFGVDTFWNPPDAYLHAKNPTYHNCDEKITGLSHDNQTGAYWPCLDPKIFNPVNLDPDEWMAASAALGMKEICLTAKHQGGFALWPSKYTNYSVAAAVQWQGGKGNVLRQFTDAANRAGIKICYYCNPEDDGYLSYVEKVDTATYIEKQLGMITELLEEYGPVNRFWFDGIGIMRPNGTDSAMVHQRAVDLIREKSPETLISPYMGDVCATTGSLYTSMGPKPNSSDAALCTDPSESGQYFHPSEMHGITIQEGPDGNSDAMPTYWFWHPWACAFNISGCPWVGHANASRIFDSYVVTVGHGAVLNMNIPPDQSGQMNASVAKVMYEAGKALNDTFHFNNAGLVSNQSGDCGLGIATVVPTGEFDYIVTMEDLRFGQRIANYSVEFRRTGSKTWEVLVPPVVSNSSVSIGDRPDGHDPRDSYVGHKRIDVPKSGIATSGPNALSIAEVRFSCIRKVQIASASDAVYLRQFSLHKKVVPWE